MTIESCHPDSHFNEGLAAAACAKNITDEQLSELKETLDLQEFYIARGNVDNIRIMDSRFHELVYRMSGSGVLYDTLLPLHKKVQKFRKASVENADRASQSAREHRAIYEAIAARNPDLAERCTYEHIANAAAHIKIKL